MKTRIIPPRTRILNAFDSRRGIRRGDRASWQMFTGLPMEEIHPALDSMIAAGELVEERGEIIRRLLPR